MPHLAGAVRLTTAKAGKLPAPKIRQISIRPVANGLNVTHKMRGAPDKQFVFQNPAKMVQHLKRIENTAWLHPMQDPAPRITSVLDIGAEA